MTAVLPEVITSTAFCAAVDRDALDGAIKFITSLLAARPQMSVLGGVLLEADDTGVTFSGFDFEVATRQRLAGTGSGRALISARTLKDMVAKFAKGELVTFATIEGKLSIRCGRRTYKLPLLDLDDYPTTPALPQAAAVISAADFALLPKVTVAAGRDDTLPALRSVCFDLDVKAGTVTAAATDRYRLARLRLDGEVSTDAHVLAYADTVAKAVKQLAKLGDVTIGVTARDGDQVPMVSFSAGDRQIIARAEEYDFPRYQALLPEDSEAVLEVESKALLDALDGARPVLPRNAAIRLVMNVVGGTVEANGHDGEEHSEYLGGTYTGEPMTAGYNPSYLADGVKAVGDTVQLHLKVASRPVVLAGPEGLASSYVYLLMPVRLSD